LSVRGDQPSRSSWKAEAHHGFVSEKQEHENPPDPKLAPVRTAPRRRGSDMRHLANLRHVITAPSLAGLSVLRSRTRDHRSTRAPDARSVDPPAGTPPRCPGTPDRAAWVGLSAGIRRNPASARSFWCAPTACDRGGGDPVGADLRRDAAQPHVERRLGGLLGGPAGIGHAHRAVDTFTMCPRPRARIAGSRPRSSCTGQDSYRHVRSKSCIRRSSGEIERRMTCRRLFTTTSTWFVTVQHVRGDLAHPGQIGQVHRLGIGMPPVAVIFPRPPRRRSTCGPA